ncbi:MAG TPA: hypothetical protein VFR58_07215 [Flavisolibacter sp.]|nr:hypothetical protein [Flavisolibacter sp.]
MKKKITSLFVLFLMLCQSGFCEDIFSAAGKKILRSQDGGKSWEAVWDSDMDSKIPGAFLTSITQGNGIILAAGGTLVMSADKGNTWKEVPIVGHTGSNNLLEKYLSHVCFGKGVFILAFPFHILYSSDGLNWRYIDKSKPSMLTASTAQEGASADGDKKKKGLGKGLGMLKGDDKAQGSGSKTASSQANPAGLTNAMTFIKSPLKINFINDRFFITGGNRSMEMVCLKIDGTELKVEKVYDLYNEYGNAATLGTGGLGNIASDGKTLVVVAQGSSKTAFSADGGASWKFFKNPGEMQTQSVAFGKGLYVGVNQFGDVLTTPAAEISKGWVNKAKFSSRTSVANQVIFYKDRFYVFCHNAEVFSSTDGKTWNRLTEGINVGTNFYEVIFL